MFSRVGESLCENMVPDALITLEISRSGARGSHLYGANVTDANKGPHSYVELMAVTQ